MTHDPDMQKEAIIAHQKRNGFAPANTLTGQFQTIMEDPYITPDERRERLLKWAHRNRAHIVAALRHGEPA